MEITRVVYKLPKSSSQQPIKETKVKLICRMNHREEDRFEDPYNLFLSKYSNTGEPHFKQNNVNFRNININIVS